ncbi:MAG: anhydro-N-acetylmuramic acid kinase [Nitrospiraceae bacterium]
MDDQLATCAAWTAEAIERHADGSRGRSMKSSSGGGVHNRAVMSDLARVFEGIPVKSFDDLGWDSKAFEATAFALLAHQTAHGRCTSVMQVTGARSPVLLGMLAPGATRRRRPWIHG